MALFDKNMAVGKSKYLVTLHLHDLTQPWFEGFGWLWQSSGIAKNYLAYDTESLFCLVFQFAKRVQKGALLFSTRVVFHHSFWLCHTVCWGLTINGSGLKCSSHTCKRPLYVGHCRGWLNFWIFLPFGPHWDSNHSITSHEQMNFWEDCCIHWLEPCKKREK